MSAARQSADYWHWFSRLIPSRVSRACLVLLAHFALKNSRTTYTQFENKHSKSFFPFFLFFRGRERRGQREQSSFFLALPLPLAWVAAGPCIVSTIVARDGLECLQRRLPPSLLPPVTPRSACGFVANHKGSEKHTRKTACYAGY